MNFNIDKSTGIGIIALLLWASTLPFAKHCSDSIGPFTTVAIAYSTSGLIGILYSLFVRKSNPLRFEVIGSRLFALRVSMYIAYFLLLYSAISIVTLTNYPVVVLINYLWPSFTLLFSLLFFPQKFRKYIFLIGTVLIITGICIEVLYTQVLGDRNSISFQPIPYLLTLFAALTWGLYSALNRKWGASSTKGEEIPGIMIGVGIFFSVLVFYLGEKSIFSFDIIFPLVYLSVIPFISNVCWDIGTRLGNLNALSLLADLVPWLSLTITAIYLNVAVGYATWIAAVLIVIGAMVSRYSLLSAVK